MDNTNKNMEKEIKTTIVDIMNIADQTEEAYYTDRAIE